MSYVPLRVHGHHSMLTGVDSPRALVERAARLGLPALALADVDGMAGVVDFLEAAREVSFQGPSQEPSKVRPILAAELSDSGGRPGRLIALVRNEHGYRNLCKLISARHLGADPGVAGAVLEGEEQFDLARSAVRHSEGLTFLVDHPRLLLELFGRVPDERLLVAISPASVGRLSPASASGTRPVARSSTRNVHRSGEHMGRKKSGAGVTGGGKGRSTAGGWGAGGLPAGGALDAAPADESQLQAPKTPPPAPPVDALELIEAARSTGVAILAVPDVYHALPSGAVDHRVRTAIKHSALTCDLPDAWLAAQPAHLPTFAEVCALYADLPDVPGPFGRSDSSTSDRPGHVPAMVARTLEVADTCRWTPTLGGVHFPEVELADDESAYSRLWGIVFEGARRRYRPLKPEVVRRLDYELSTIDDLGFAPYFLLVHRIAEFARERGIPCVGRGSAADSLVSYCMDLTDADPLRYGLPFERFLNPSRKDRPDIDLDFCWRRRDEVLEHVYEAFGPERTAMISTLNCFGLRSAFRETALAWGIPPVEVNRWSKRLPWSPPPGDAEPVDNAHDDQQRWPDDLACNPVARALRSTPECRDFPADDERWQRVLRASESLLGAPRHYGLHPGGVVVSPGAITDFAACHRSAKGVVTTQLDKDAVEAIGLVKMDLLGNRALTTLDDCLKALRQRGVELDLGAIPEDCPRTAELLREGRTLGCFQVESPGMRNLLQQTGACTMDDVIQAIALIRPGPASSGMKDAYVRRFRGLEEPHPPHPRLTELLWDTHGVMLYQEDVMQTVALVAGMDLAESDLLRRTLQKSHGRDLGPLRQRFLHGAAEQGIAHTDAARIWELVANFASFAFCKAHAVTYGRISYRAVYLKAWHPALYMAAFLASETGYYAPRVYVEEARRLGVAILAPDVNRSTSTFAIEWVPTPNAEPRPALRIGLRQIKGLSERTLEAILEGREQRGPFLSLTDFLERTGAHSDETAHLVQCGAFDSFDRTRPELLWRLHLLRTPRTRVPRTAPEGTALDIAMLDACKETPESRTRARLSPERGGWSSRSLGIARTDLPAGETASLFGEPETPALVLPGLPDVDPATRGRLEFELLGLTVDAHPTELFDCPADERIAALVAEPRRGAGRRTLPVNPIDCREVLRADGRVTLRGWPAASRRVRTQNGQWMRFLTLEDPSGLAEVVLFPDVYQRDGHLLAGGGPVCVTGTVEDQLGARTVHAERIW